jgi:hypothetical protein
MYIGPQLRKMSFDPLSSLMLICGLIQSPQLFVVNKASPFHTLGDCLTQVVRPCLLPPDTDMGADMPGGPLRAIRRHVRVFRLP